MFALAFFRELDPLTSAECGRLRGVLLTRLQIPRRTSRVKYRTAHLQPVLPLQ